MPPSEAAITPYLTATPQKTTAPTATTAPTFTPLPLPTPTPFMYFIAQNDTLIGIANTFGITLDELLIANPGVNANLLIVGEPLVIPLPTDEENAPATASAEVLPLTVSAVTCHQNPLEGMWCLWPVSNSTEQPVENLAGIIRLYDRGGKLVQSQTAYNLLNVLLPGQKTALAVYFPPPLPDWERAEGQLISAAPANQYQERYLAAAVIDFTADPLDEAGLGMQVSGNIQVTFPEEGAPPASRWVLALALDANGEIIGLRRWTAQEEGPIEETVNFSFQLASLGGPIEEVELLVEARTGGP